jgi:hypothetical protein
VPESRARTAHERRHIHVHHARPIIVAGFENTAAVGDAGIVDEDVQATEVRQCLGSHAIGKGGVGDVARKKSGAKFVCERRAGRLIAARQHQCRARGCDFSGYGETDTRGRAGNQCSFSR